ncbi:hypothetical protein [Marinomonas balearica]|uniref:DUF1127 domain-containing protein n=1 Tax=Marinomonas balearica TaxID=491947 RepID=A0A4R6MF54_9GAMM|nr:hypothetical protein [Marinomonas balearica]TDO99925.1 hypothetical protein DFP79_0936 [Marinomonas balearica]
MSLIALINAAKEYFIRRQYEASFKQLDNHSLKDIGFYREEGRIRPLSGNSADKENNAETVKAPPSRLPLDG